MLIDRLTPDQTAKLTDIRTEWEAVGLATGPADRARAERGIRRAYAAAGLPPPSICIWARSPLEAVVGGAHLGVDGEGHLARALEETYLELTGRPVSGLWGRLWAPFRAPSDDPLADFLARQVGFDPRAISSHVDAVWDSSGRELRFAISAGLAAQVRAEVGDPVRRHVIDRLLVPIGSQLQAEVWPQLKAQLEVGYGRRRAWLRRWAVVRDLHRLLRIQDAMLAPSRRRTTIDRLAMADSYGRVCGLDAAGRMNGLIEVARAAGSWWPHRSGVVLCERPTRLALDDQGRLHSDLGAAVEYPDGWTVWARHGVPVPRREIED